MNKQIAVRTSCWLGLLCGFALLAGCSHPPPPNERQALKLVHAYVKQSGGLDAHEGLGHARRYRPIKLFAVRTRSCKLIDQNAYWCDFAVDFATAEQDRVTSAIALRVEYENGEYRGVRF